VLCIQSSLLAAKIFRNLAVRLKHTLLSNVLVQLVPLVDRKGDCFLGKGTHTVREAKAIRAGHLGNYGECTLLLALNRIVRLSLWTKYLHAVP
jgi:hypothetical protein